MLPPRRACTSSGRARAAPLLRLRQRPLVEVGAVVGLEARAVLGLHQRHAELVDPVALCATGRRRRSSCRVRPDRACPAPSAAPLVQRTHSKLSARFGSPPLNRGHRANRTAAGARHGERRFVSCATSCSPAGSLPRSTQSTSAENMIRRCPARPSRRDRRRARCTGAGTRPPGRRPCARRRCPRSARR